MEGEAHVTSGPVSYSASMGAWIVTGEYVSEVLGDHTRFSSALIYRSSARAMDINPEVEEVLGSVMPLSTLQLTGTDPPEHRRLRRVGTRLFRTNFIKGFEGRIRCIADELIAAFDSSRRVDIASAFTKPLAVRSVLSFLGVPAENQGRVWEWFRDFSVLAREQLDLQRQIACARSNVNLQRYLLELIELRRTEPADDFLSQLAAGGVSNEPNLSIAESVVLAQSLIAAGTETTTLVLNSYLFRILRERKHWEELSKNLDSIDSYTDEALRCDRSQRGLMRETIEDVKLGDMTIPRGSSVLVLHTSANHDPRQFNEPETFNPNRTNADKNLAFGHGVHRCLGSGLARLQMNVAIAALISRLPTLRLIPTEPPSISKRPGIRSVTKMIVEWDA